jgi:hypothetical protein
MRYVLKLSILLVFLVLVTAVWAEEKQYKVAITLTEGQIKQVKGGYGRNVTVEFTAAQIRTIQEVLPRFDLTEFTLTSSHLGRGDEIMLVIDVFEDPRRLLFEANPQPSP